MGVVCVAAGLLPIWNNHRAQGNQLDAGQRCPRSHSHIQNKPSPPHLCSSVGMKDAWGSTTSRNLVPVKVCSGESRRRHPTQNRQGRAIWRTCGLIPMEAPRAMLGPGEMEEAHGAGAQGGTEECGKMQHFSEHNIQMGAGRGVGERYKLIPSL